jgi:uncharacterized protein
MNNNVIIGRDAELRVLEEIFSARDPQFVAVYGRRRVGKTYLIRNFFEKKPALFFDVTGAPKTPLAVQIANFTTRIGEMFYQGAKLMPERNWNSAFRILTDAIKKITGRQKIVLFFDETPWLATRNSGFLSALDYYWNQYWSRDNRIRLIICGSSASWIIKKIINNKGGLHNRVTQSIRLEPFNLRETKLFLEYSGIKLNNQQLTELFMVTGGVAHYLKKIKKKLSVTKNIEELAFTKNSFFLTEFENLFLSLFDDGESYIDIIRCLAQSKTGVSQGVLFEKIETLSKGGRATNKLHALEDAGFIMTLVPHFHQKKGIYYKLVDEYSLFYLRWIEPVKQTLLTKGLKEHYWEGIRNTAAWNNWAGYAFENLCYRHLNQISDALHIPATAIPNAWRYVPISSATDQGAQIDLLFDRQDDAITLCEIKYTKAPFVVDKEYARILQQKIQVFRQKTRTQKQIFVTIISANGLKPTMYSEEMISDVVTIDDLMKK